MFYSKGPRKGKRFLTMKNLKTWPKNSAGFTLVEILMVMFIMAIVVGAVYSLFYRSQKVYADQAQVVNMQQNARAAVEMICRDLWLAGYWPNPNRFQVSTAGILVAGTNSIQFSADLDKNGNTTGAEENILYAYNSTDPPTPGPVTRQRVNTGEAPQVVADNVTSFQITYYLIYDGTIQGIGAGNAAGTLYQVGPGISLDSPPASVDAAITGLNPQDRRNMVRKVRVSLTAQTSVADLNYGLNGGFRQYSLNGDVALRNLNYLN
jgi:prepilin-type N-terminal cleavage/methylation domain-containing protein